MNGAKLFSDYARDRSYEHKQKFAAFGAGGGRFDYITYLINKKPKVGPADYKPKAPKV